MNVTIKFIQENLSKKVLTKHKSCDTINTDIGLQPSGKARDFGSRIPQVQILPIQRGYDGTSRHDSPRSC